MSMTSPGTETEDITMTKKTSNGGDAAQTEDRGNGAAAGQPEQGQPPPQSLDKVEAMGHGVWLMTQVPTHKHLFLVDLEWALMPPIALGQFRLWRDKGMPVGLATWAYLSEEVEKRMLESGVNKLAPQDWKSGDRLWVMDMLFPFGGADLAKKEMMETVFAGQKPKTTLPTATGQARIITWE